ncbi:MAG: histidine triad nucleotide-binding protein [Candidatus Margulisbacteria bacterium]|nr:histidine triad nucleotide-binding protein [Candidatus Margulisiibacteriota bacterium]
MTSCLFCKIVKGTIPADIIYNYGDVLAFRDIAPKAPHHILVIPKQHFQNVLGLTEEHARLMVQLFVAIDRISKELGVSDSGFRIVTNTGETAGQTVDHLHFHLLAGRSFSWPPG